MSDEVKPAEQGQQSTPQQTATAETSKTETQTTPQTESLEDVYKKYNVEAEAQNFSAKPQQQPRQEATQQQEQQQEISIPDPTLQPNEYKAFEARKQKETQALRQALHQMDGKLGAFMQAAVRAQEEADIKTAVSEVNDHLGDKKLDPDEVEIRLGTKAKKDPRFLKIWQNRGQNPAALRAALKAIAGEIGKKTEYRVDPQIAENQRALKEATSTKATTAPEQSMEEKLAKLPPAKFNRAMAQIRAGQTPTLD